LHCVCDHSFLDEDTANGLPTASQHSSNRKANPSLISPSTSQPKTIPPPQGPSTAPSNPSPSLTSHPPLLVQPPNREPHTSVSPPSTSIPTPPPTFRRKAKASYPPVYALRKSQSRLCSPSLPKTQLRSVLMRSQPRFSNPYSPSAERDASSSRRRRRA
jgi:hypothetical protein